MVYNPNNQLDEDTVKLLFFMTDGCMDGRDVEGDVQEDIFELSQKGWNIASIGLDFDQDDLERLQSFTQPGIAKSYKSSELVSVLGEDIYNTIVDNFIKVK